mmetsp:Transcript_9575/g.25852  ORF Transcript_9575/g.25852 Transcript_9575/m.25852 type:complete len:235 (+) Transcript_9575:1880-2584(+)
MPAKASQLGCCCFALGSFLLTDMLFHILLAHLLTVLWNLLRPQCEHGWNVKWSLREAFPGCRGQPAQLLMDGLELLHPRVYFCNDLALDLAQSKEAVVEVHAHAMHGLLQKEHLVALALRGHAVLLRNDIVLVALQLVVTHVLLCLIDSLDICFVLILFIRTRQIERMPLRLSLLARQPPLVCLGELGLIHGLLAVLARTATRQARPSRHILCLVTFEHSAAACCCSRCLCLFG